MVDIAPYRTVEDRKVSLIRLAVIGGLCMKRPKSALCIAIALFATSAAFAGWGGNIPACDTAKTYAECVGCYLVVVEKHVQSEDLGSREVSTLTDSWIPENCSRYRPAGA